MSTLVFYKLLAIFITVALGWFAGRMRWLGEASADADPARMLSNAAFYIFVPALMFRATARLDLSAMPRATVLAYFLPVMLMLLGVYAVQRWRRPMLHGASAEAAEQAAAVPAVRALAVTFGNSVQIGIPLAAALWGEAGLGIHIALVSLHALALLSVVTALIELDIARAQAAHRAASSLWRTLRTTARATIIHPVMLPVLAGLAWNLTGLALPGPIDETLQLLGTAVAPLCLVLIGLSLAYYGIGNALSGAVVIALLKLLALPALVLGVAHWGLGLRGLPLQVVVVMAALPTGANPLILAQRYRANESEVTAAVVVYTLGFALTAPLWLALLARIG